MIWLVTKVLLSESKDSRTQVKVGTSKAIKLPKIICIHSKGLNPLSSLYKNKIHMSARVIFLSAHNTLCS